MIEIVKTSGNSQKKIVDKAKKYLLSGKMLVVPTDTVYGFICVAHDKKAVGKIFKIKKRPKSKPISVFVGSIAAAKRIAVIDKEQEKFLRSVWPGATIAILTKKSGGKIYGTAKKTIGIRIPKHRLLQKILNSTNVPLSQTSVNISGQPFLKDVRKMVQWLGTQKQKPDLIIDAGVSSRSKPSKVIDLIGPKIKILRK